MLQFAAILGTFFGAILKECAPVLAEILAEGIRRAQTTTVENSKADDALHARLNAILAARLPKPVGDAGSDSQAGRPGTTGGASGS